MEPCIFQLRFTQNRLEKPVYKLIDIINICRKHLISQCMSLRMIDELNQSVSISYNSVG